MLKTTEAAGVSRCEEQPNSGEWFLAAMNADWVFCDRESRRLAELRSVLPRSVVSALTSADRSAWGDKLH